LSDAVGELFERNGVCSLPRLFPHQEVLVLALVLWNHAVMKISDWYLTSCLVLFVALMWGCGDLGSGTLSIGAPDDDDTTADDDDTTADDDDTTADDDDTTADDDDTTADDDDDDDDDDDTVPGQDHELTGDYEGSILMFIETPGGGPGGGGGGGGDPTCSGDAELEVEDDGEFSVEGECTIGWLSLTYSFELEGTVSDSLQFVGEATETNSWTNDVSHYESLGWIEDGEKILIEWDGQTPGQGGASRPYLGQAWFRVSD